MTTTTRLILTLTLALAVVVIVLGVVCLSMVLPGLFAFAPWAAGIVSGWCVADTLCDLWKPEVVGL